MNEGNEKKTVITTAKEHQLFSLFTYGTVVPYKELVPVHKS